MSNIQPAAPTALSKSGPINASSLLCMIARTNKIELTGFSNPKTKWFAPGVRFVGLAKTGRNEVGAELSWQSARTRKVIVACAVMLGLSLLAASALFSMAVTSVRSHDATLRPMAWSAQKIEMHGLWIRSGSNDVFIPVGNRLPNGEVLVSTSRQNNSYTTPGGVTTMGSQQ